MTIIAKKRVKKKKQEVDELNDVGSHAQLCESRPPWSYVNTTLSYNLDSSDWFLIECYDIMHICLVINNQMLKLSSNLTWFDLENNLTWREFDRVDELFATAGVSQRIKVFDYSMVLNEPTDVHCPVVEMCTRCKVSCLNWNKYSKNHIASSDYGGTVTEWDITTCQSPMEYEENEKRAWSVDSLGQNHDCKVKVWCTKQEASVINIDMKANICCVGSADHRIHCFDLRNISTPIHVFSGHKKTVSYMKFLSENELTSASTDSTLKLWDAKKNLPLRTFRGHAKENNFVGLTINSYYIACGSETNEVYVYQHKQLSFFFIEIAKPVTWHRFGSKVMDDAHEDAGSHFISAVCWKSDSLTLLIANSQGTIKVLVLAAW
ncbi:hypothetical protein J1N35_008478 [Gossypium stocksii]|uniref:Anaphase-promoting complex subunit 4 WD40 domain-containing protein n=1 Tax=Gossypium stocksii TaxID=47602 RepID=A0A9D3WAF5_9ROSI|nr:hypothetical protein J1N35_008478 [Gossypium stocksii]